MHKTFLLFACLLWLACTKPADNTKALQKRIDSLERLLPCCSNSEYLAQAALWFQQSPEMRAGYLQSYQMARQALDVNLKHKANKKKKNAVVVDIDETILNNGPYEGWLYLNNTTYTDSSWNAWVHSAQAEPLPGALEFLQYAASRGCQVFYISNRKADVLTAPTLKNLQKFNFPNADTAHLMLKTADDVLPNGKTTKQKRREKVEQQLNCEIMLLCGDQLADFTHAFDLSPDGTEKQIMDSVNAHTRSFGSRFFIIPNPMYSDWLNQTLYGNDKNKTCTHVDSVRSSKMVYWK